MSKALSGLYTVGSYRLDVASRVLTRSGAMVTLAPKTFDLLVFLAESDGRLLSKRELMEALWNGTFVEEANLSFQMSSLRKALGEEGNGWIEAVPKYGYRFKAPVERSAVPESFQPDVAQAPRVERKIAETRSRGARVLLIAGAVAALVIAVGFAGWLLWFRKQGASAPLHVVPVTSYRGRETTPSFSPDGSQIAFSWDGEKGDNLDVYVKLVGENRALRLTSDPRPEFSPAWSPDGRHIAFCRDVQDGSEIVLISALGGPERVIAKLQNWGEPEHSGDLIASSHRDGDPNDRPLAWFPDGEALAIVGRSSRGGPDIIFLLSVGTGEMKALTSPPDRSWGDDLPSVSPDGHSLAFARILSEYFTSARLYVVRLSDTKVPTGEPQGLVRLNDDIVSGLAWTSDSRRLIFASGRRLWSLALRNSVIEPLALPGYNPKSLAISAKGDRIAFAEATEDLDIWRIDGPAITADGSGGAPVPATKVISSTQMDTNPQYSPDGSRIAFTSSRSGTVQIWVCDSDGSDPVQLTNFEMDAATPRWSPDGRYIAFDSPTRGTGDVYVVPAQGGPVRRITTESSDENMASWSPDGKWIYFQSNRSGVYQIWKAPFAGGTAVQVTHNGGAEAFESRDGKFLYYTKWGQRGIWRKPMDSGGEEALIIDRGSPYHWGLFDKGVCLTDLEAVAGPTIDCLDFGTKRVTTVSRLPKGIHINQGGPSFSVSHDGRRILYVGAEREEGDIMMVDNFR